MNKNEVTPEEMEDVVSPEGTTDAYDPEEDEIQDDDIQDDDDDDDDE